MTFSIVGGCELKHHTPAKPEAHAGNRLVGNDVLPVGPEKVAGVELFGQLVESLLKVECLARLHHGLDRTVIDVEIADLLHTHGHEAVALDGDQEVGFVTLLPLQGPHHRLQVGSRLRGAAQHLQLVDGLLQVAAADGFQQIGDAVHPESLQGILVVGGGKDDGTGDVDMLEDAEGRPVGQVYIHEYQLGHGMSGKPLQRTGHTVGLAYDVKLGIDLFHGRLQVAQGRFFVFYNQGLHINGKVTLKFFSLSSMVMSRPKSKR